MSQAALPLMPPPSETLRISSPRPTSFDAQPRCVKAAPCRGSRNGDLPSTVPAPPTPTPTPASTSPTSQSLPTPKQALVSKRSQAKRQTLARLQAEIDRIERARSSSFVSSGVLREPASSRLRGVVENSAPPADGLWLSGDGKADGELKALGFDKKATHEIKPAVSLSPRVAAGGLAAALAFALRLAARRSLQMDQDRGRGNRARTILFCATSHFMRETGRLYGPGLRALGLLPEQLLIVETLRPAETLWAMEEGLKSGALDTVVGCLEEIDLTPARRLSLAAKAYATPCLLVTGSRSPSVGATSSRWRVGMVPGEPCPFDACAPGEGNLNVQLEKLRRRGVQDIGSGDHRVAGAVAGRMAG